MRFSFLKTIAGGLILGAMVGSIGSAQAQEFTFKLHHFLPPVAPAHAKMLAPWAEKIKAESGGRIQIDIYPSMQLGGKPPQLMDQVRDGVVDMVWTLPGYTPGRFTRTEVFELPFLHSNTLATNRSLQAYAQKHGEDFKDYQILIHHVHAGQLFHSHNAIRKLSDVKGLKIRTPNRIGGWMIEAMGATPVGAPVPAIPEMLSKKVVDAVLIPYEVTLPLKVHEMVKYHTSLDDPIFPRMNTSTFVVAMNKAKYEALPADLKKVMDDNSGANDEIVQWVSKIWSDVENPGRMKAEETGELIKLPPAEVAELRKMAEQSVAERWIADVSKKDIDGKALYAEARALLEKYSK